MDTADYALQAFERGFPRLEHDLQHLKHRPYREANINWAVKALLGGGDKGKDVIREIWTAGFVAGTYRILQLVDEREAAKEARLDIPAGKVDVRALEAALEAAAVERGRIEGIRQAQNLLRWELAGSTAGRRLVEMLEDLTRTKETR